MPVLVRYFAALRELQGRDSESVALEPGETAGELYQRLVRDKGQGRLPVLYSVNHAYAQATQVLRDGDEVAFLPPLGGG